MPGLYLGDSGPVRRMIAADVPGVGGGRGVFGLLVFLRGIPKRAGGMNVWDLTITDATCLGFRVP